MLVIVDEIREVIEAVRAEFITADQTEPTVDDTIVTMDGGGAPYYLYGHRQEIATRLMRKDRSRTSKASKYPLIGLRLDTAEKMVGDVAHFTLNIAIINRTKPTYTSDQRYSEVFVPILYPLYELLFVKLREHGFMWPSNLERPEHTKIDRLFWGTAGTEKNDKNIFNEPVDAIELLDLQINKSVDSFAYSSLIAK